VLAKDAATADTGPGMIPGTRFEVDPSGHLYDSKFRAILAAKSIPAEMLLSIEAVRCMVLAGKTAYASFEEALSEIEVTHQQFRTLLCIDGYGAAGTQLHPIAQWLGVTPRNVTAIMDALEAQGLVERVADPTDRRAIIARLTPAGRAKAQKGTRIHQAALRRVTSALTDDEKLQLRHLSLKLLAAAEQAAPDRRKANG
jgi:DNA-binding MarR family transcriptional regulator